MYIESFVGSSDKAAVTDYGSRTSVSVIVSHDMYVTGLFLSGSLHTSGVSIAAVKFDGLVGVTLGGKLYQVAMGDSAEFQIPPVKVLTTDTITITVDWDTDNNTDAIYGNYNVILEGYEAA